MTPLNFLPLPLPAPVTHFDLPFLCPLSHVYQTEQTVNLHTTAHMHVTACLAGQKADVEVGEDCRTLQALRAAIVVALPQLCVEGFDVSVGGRGLDDDGVVSLQDDVCLDVSANACGLSVLALREAGREVSEAGLLAAVNQGDMALCTLYLDAGVQIDCVDREGRTPLFLSCFVAEGYLVATLLLDRGSTAIDEKDSFRWTPLFASCYFGHLEIATLLLDRGSNAIDENTSQGETPLFISCTEGHLEIVTLLLDRGSNAIDCVDDSGTTPLSIACSFGHLEIATLLLNRGSTAIDKKSSQGQTPLFIVCCAGHLLMSYGASTRKRTRWRTPAWTGRQRTRRTSTFDRCRRTRHPANGWGTAVNSPWKVYHLRRSVRAA